MFSSPESTVPHGVRPPEQLLNVPNALVPVGSTEVLRKSLPAAGPVITNSVVPVIRRLYWLNTGVSLPEPDSPFTCRTERPCAASAMSNCSRVGFSSSYPLNRNGSVVYSWLTTSKYAFGVPSMGSRPAKSLLKPNCMACAAAVWLSKSNSGAPSSTGSPHRMMMPCSYPSGTTTASSVLGATAVKSTPSTGGVSVDPAEPVAAGSSVLQAARTPPAPTATTAIAPPRSTPRLDIAVLTMSPKYWPFDVFGTSWKHASPHLYLHVRFDREELPS